MNSRRVITVIVALTALFVMTGTAFPQNKTKEIPVVTVDTILNKAECPLTEKQAEQFKKLDLSGGREVFRTLYEMFDEKQMEALKKPVGYSVKTAAANCGKTIFNTGKSLGFHP